ncbi:hypothetical protein LMG28138_03909 [Pararobbsia alpina]|uniref:Lipoprotein n=1 Tax=Pararobbsia alpina TaxID=621374 RepID=A0A6S7CQV9_9BURK|nr:hypothetical protein LMG28138_03909 [Pararobbsia alpina]
MSLKKLAGIVLAAIVIASAASVAGCNEQARADSPRLGEYLGTTGDDTNIARIVDGGHICYVATHRRLTAPLAISCI